MQRTINHTGRRKIEAKELQINMQEQSNGIPAFDVDFSLNRDKLPDNASIYIEAYQRNTLQRFNFGTVSEIRKPENRELDQLDLSSPALFRIRIVDETENLGRLIASAEKLKPEGDNDEDQRSSLLVVRCRNLEQQTWKIDFETGGKPELCINSRIPDAIGQLKNNPLFQSLILPGAFRQVLMFFLWNDDDEDEGGIAEEWMTFAEHIAYERPEGKDPLQLTLWVDDVVTRFSETFVLCDILLHKLEEPA